MLQLNEIAASIAIQNEDFENLILGSTVTFAEIVERAPFDWYMDANEAQKLGLVSAVF